MTDTSDYESDAGASPSVSSDESGGSASSGSLSPPGRGTSLSRSTSTPVAVSTPKKRVSIGRTVTTPGTSFSSSSLCTSPVSTGHKPGRKLVDSGVGINSRSRARGGGGGRGGSQSDSNKVVGLNSTRKRKLQVLQACTSPESQRHSDQDVQLSPETKRRRNKRRRTRSERNIRAGKTSTTIAASANPIVAEGEEAVALDAEIDRVLEEKAMKNNLSATNVKSIIRHVITNNMVQKMIMSAMRKKAEAADGGGGSSDEDGLVEPKMTRAKTKELMANKQTPLWPIVESPVKMKKQLMSETHMLIQHDLPEDSSGDEEYVPQDEMGHSDDENSSVSSFASDHSANSPAVHKGVITRRSLQLAEKSPSTDPLFKTPPPRPKSGKKREEKSAISRRTRSKHPLNDTPLEYLERQLIPPDITNDMYDWGETDNEDYLTFLKEFLFPGQCLSNEVGDEDDAADPEYNVMEDDEDVHDREELRRDRAVKVPKKELNELVAELIEEYHVSSGDELEDLDLTSLTTSVTPFGTESGFGSADNRRLGPEIGPLAKEIHDSVDDVDGKSSTAEAESSMIVVPESSVAVMNVVDTVDSTNLVVVENSSVKENETAQVCSSASILSQAIVEIKGNPDASTSLVKEGPAPAQKEELFRECDLKFLQHQIRQHIQLLAQSYVLTVSNEDSVLKHIAKMSKSMIIELRNFAQSTGPRSNFAVCNLEPAWNLTHFWPHKFLQKSPIKKKILEERYINEAGIEEGTRAGNYFPRHVVKIIAENPTFLYNNLLPEHYNQKNMDTRCRFTFSEDALLVSAMEDLKEFKKTASQMADIISEVLLVVHPQPQVYHRIRNLRKSNQYCDPVIKRYFTDGILPEPERTVPELTPQNMLPLAERDKSGLSKHWIRLLQHVEESSAYKWEEQLKKDPITKSLLVKWNKKRLALNSKKKKEEENTGNHVVINRVFPKGVVQFESEDPNFEAVPLLNSSGRPGAIIYIPKYALNLNPPQQSSQSECTTAPESSGGLADGNQSYRINKLNILELNHLILKSQTTPRKREIDSELVADNDSGNRNEISTTSAIVREKFCEIKALPTREPTSVCQFTLPNSLPVVPVGKPFYLPELNSANQVIDVSALQTPVKKVIYQKVAEQEQAETENVAQDNTDNQIDYEADDIDYDDDDDSNSSCKVLEEGTEVELTSDEDLLEEPDNYEAEVVTLSSSDEGDGVKMTQEPRDNGDGKEKKGDGGSSNSNTNRQQGSSLQTSANCVASSSVKRTSTRTGRGGGDESDDDNDRRQRKRALPKDAKDEGTSKEDEEKNSHQNPLKRQQTSSSIPTASAHSSNQMQPPPNKSPSGSHAQSSSKTSHANPKKARKSSANQQGSRRVSKYNVTPAEKMLQEDSNDFDDVADAYMESYLLKVHSVTEKKNPGLYSTFIQILHEAGEKPINQAELHAKVKILFKDYSELLKEFESFLDPNFNCETNDVPPIAGSSGHDETMSHIQFLQQLDKFTENCPQLKAKIMSKAKSLKENPAMSEKDVVAALEPFFVGNPVMMDSFKALFPSVFRPQSVSSGIDFEVVELDTEDPPNDDLHFEVVKLPEETTVPATNTCPCCCHTKTSDPTFANRSKHCRKCSLKDGKIYIHNGRVMRPVSVELTPATSKHGHT